MNNENRYKKFIEDGFDYLMNSENDELHRLSWDNYYGSCHLNNANLQNFIGIKNINEDRPIHFYRDGENIEYYDLDTGKFLGVFPLNKCQHCFVIEDLRRLGKQTIRNKSLGKKSLGKGKMRKPR